MKTWPWVGGGSWAAAGRAPQSPISRSAAARVLENREDFISSLLVSPHSTGKFRIWMRGVGRGGRGCCPPPSRAGSDRWPPPRASGGLLPGTGARLFGLWAFGRAPAVGRALDRRSPATVLHVRSPSAPFGGAPRPPSAPHP